jgi:hypothetical protein
VKEDDMVDKEYMLTTVDNPYNPFTNFRDWFGFDEAAGHHSTALLGRIVRTSSDLSEADQSLAISQAIDEIVKENVSGVHIKFFSDSTRST